MKKPKVTTVKEGKVLIYWLCCDLCGVNKKVDNWEASLGHGEGVCDKDNITRKANGKQQKLMEVKCDI